MPTIHDYPNVKPILFNTEMVRAILDGRKTVTRRICKPLTLNYPKNAYQNETPVRWLGRWKHKPRYQPGDILYVRETWNKLTDWHDEYPDDDSDMAVTYYRADYQDDMASQAKWHPSIHMPKEAARIFLRVTDVRVERLQDITEEQARREGTKSKRDFIRVWNNTIPDKDSQSLAWSANPWVWVYEFEQIHDNPELLGGAGE